MSFVWIDFHFIGSCLVDGWHGFLSGGHMAYSLFADMFSDIFFGLIHHWVWVLGFVAYWIVAAAICDWHERKSTFYPAFRFHMWAIAPFVGFIAPFYYLLHGMMYLLDKDYRIKSKEGKQDDTLVGGSAFVALFVGVHLVVGLMAKNTPPEIEDVKFTGANGLVCYAHMKYYGKDKDKPFISHSHCDEPSRALASVSKK